MHLPSPGTIDDVLDQLDTIVNDALRSPARIGYFTALYERVTLNVKRAIIAGNVFQNNDRMAHLDVVFAGRFLDAWKAYHDGTATTQAWKVAFDALSNERHIVLQHLLLGMNAHINLDLGIAAATVAPTKEALAALKPDFDRINTILARLVGVVELELGEISPRLKAIEALGPSIENRLFDFALDAARTDAWKLAESLVRLPQAEWHPIIDARDRLVAHVGEAILHPSELGAKVVAWIRETESSDITFNIQIVGG